jgi:hypothetical protein
MKDLLVVTAAFLAMIALDILLFSVVGLPQ